MYRLKGGIIIRLLIIYTKENTKSAQTGMKR